MQTFFVNLWENIKTNVAIADVFDILIVAFLIYQVFKFIKKTRAEQITLGLVIFLVVTIASKWLHLYTLNWILSKLATVGLIAIIIIFQPELRRLLESLGRSKFTKFVNNVDKDRAMEITKEFVEAIEHFSETRTGALIIIERETTLDDIIETGTVIDANITAEMLGNIFYEGAPLHDGALIVRGDRLYAAGCVLPLTQNKRLSKDLGTRHRAAIGITEISDAYVIVVSEETGIISVAEDGKLSRFLDGKAIEKYLLELYLEAPKEDIKTKILNVFKGVKDVQK